jgi:hypothetical protein
MERGTCENGRAVARVDERALPGLDRAAGRADDARSEREDALQDAPLLGVSVPRMGTTF